VAVRRGRRHTSSHRGQLSLPFRSLGGLYEQLPTGWGHIVVCPAQTASSLNPSVKLISGGTSVDSLFSEFPDLTRPTGVQGEERHNTAHHIWTTPGEPVTCGPQLAPDRLAIAQAEFDAMLRDGTARSSEIPWSSSLHIVPKDDNG
jgi:hypothetical protein